MTRMIVDKGRCAGDGVCRDVCPKGLVHMDGGFPVLPEELESQCNLCGQCVAFCRADAVLLEPFAGETVERLDPALAVGPAEVMQLLKGRRSVRTFSAQPVSRDIIRQALAAARLAPSGANNQLVEWIVIERAEVVRELVELMADWFDTAARTDPVARQRYAIDTLLARFRSGVDVFLRGAPHLVIAWTPASAVWGAIDSAIALTHFNLAAESLGVGCCWAGYFIRAAAGSPALRARLALDPETVVQGALMFGHPRYRPYRIPCRNTQRIRWL